MNLLAKQVLCRFWVFLLIMSIYTKIQEAVQPYFLCSLIICHVHFDDQIARRCVITSQIEKEIERDKGILNLHFNQSVYRVWITHWTLGPHSFLNYNTTAEEEGRYEERQLE